MKITKKQISLLLALLLLAGAAAASVPGALAYFTDRLHADGSAAVKMTWETTPHEEMDGNNKHITIENTGETPVIVRVQVFAGAFAETEAPDGGWIAGEDGWYYYGSVLAPGAVTPELYVAVSAQTETGQDAAALPDYDFNIIVVHESARTVYEDNTTLAAPDGWAQTAVDQIDPAPPASAEE